MFDDYNFLVVVVRFICKGILLSSRDVVTFSVSVFFIEGRYHFIELKWVVKHEVRTRET